MYCGGKVGRIRTQEHFCGLNTFIHYCIQTFSIWTPEKKIIIINFINARERKLDRNRERE